MAKIYRQGKVLIRPSKLFGNPISSHLIRNQEKLAKEIITSALRIISLSLSGYVDGVRLTSQINLYHTSSYI
jgi:hypothetical protein